MVEVQKQRIEQEMNNVVHTLDKQYLRKIQGDMHRCAAKCCDNTTSSLESTHSCIERCGIPLDNANQYVQSELLHVQEKLQRCVMQCNDDIRDAMGPNPNQDVVDKLTTQFEKCATKCVDKHISAVPNLLKTMQIVLEKGAPGKKQAY